MSKPSLYCLNDEFPPSPPCSCAICKAYCRRPGWWTVDEAKKALYAGFGNRMMLEISPERSIFVLSPAFRGCEKNFALQEFSRFGCCFFSNGLCELFKSGFVPLECRFCHHERPGQGILCHAALEKDWDTHAGRCLVAQWVKLFLPEYARIFSANR